MQAQYYVALFDSVIEAGKRFVHNPKAYMQKFIEQELGLFKRLQITFPICVIARISGINIKIQAKWLT